MSILTKTFFTFVCGDLMPLSFLTTRHTTKIFFDYKILILNVLVTGYPVTSGFFY